MTKSVNSRTLSIKKLTQLFINKKIYVIFIMLYKRKGEIMITKEEKCLLIMTIVFITYLLVGSFVVSRNLLDLAYLIVFYSVIAIRIWFYK